MGAAELTLWAQLVTGAVLIIGIVLLLRRRSPGLIHLGELTVQTQTLKSDMERIERTIRENDSRSFNSAEDRRKALRAEVSEATSPSTTTLVTSLTAVGEAQKAQLESFATVLASSTRAVDDRLAGISEQQQRTLTDFARTNTDGAKALRDEVGTALKAVGDDLRQSAAQAAELQHNQLDSFAKQLREGIKALDERIETLRLAVDQKTDHLIQTLVTKLDYAQEVHAQQGKALREEVSTSLKAVGDDLRLSATNAANVRRTQLEAFAAQLSEGLSAIDGRMEALRQIVDQKITALVEGISSRFDASTEASAVAAKALREEVQATLKTVGDDLRMNAEVAATTQKDQLGNVSNKILELSQGIGQRFHFSR